MEIERQRHILVHIYIPSFLHAYMYERERERVRARAGESDEKDVASSRGVWSVWVTFRAEADMAIRFR